MQGSSSVLQTRFKRVVLPALARPMTRMRNWRYFSRISLLSLIMRLMLMVGVSERAVIDYRRVGSVGWVWNRHRLHPSYAISLVPFILLNVCCLVESWIFETGLCSQRSFWYVPSKPTELSTKWSRTSYVFLWPDEPISMICLQERHLWFLRKLNKVDFSSLLPTATAATPNIPRLSFRSASPTIHIQSYECSPRLVIYHRWLWFREEPSQAVDLSMWTHLPCPSHILTLLYLLDILSLACVDLPVSPSLQHEDFATQT